MDNKNAAFKNIQPKSLKKFLIITTTHIEHYTHKIHTYAQYNKCQFNYLSTYPSKIDNSI